MTQRERNGSATGKSFFDMVADGRLPTLPADVPDLGGYVDLLLQSGFPEALARRSERTRVAWLDSYVDHLVTRDIEFIADIRDPRRLRQFLRVLATQTAGEPTIETLIVGSSLSRSAVLRYSELLERLFVTEEVPAWSKSRLNRVAQRPKRYVCDPGIAASVLGADRRAVLRNGDLMGRLLDTFVASQLRPELVLGNRPVRMYHLRAEGGRREADIVLERSDGAAIGIEVKAASSVSLDDARHLVWLHEQLGSEEFLGGFLFYTGPFVRELADRIWALPICLLWGSRS